MSDDAAAGPEPGKDPGPSEAGREQAADIGGKAGIGEESRRPRAGSDSATVEHESQEQLAALGATYISYEFNAPVDAREAGFGPSGGRAPDEDRRRTRTGKLPPADIAELCDHFAEPPGYWAAAEALDRDRVVVLTGPAGRGKRTSALRLLRDAGAESLEVVSPTLTLVDLSKHDFAAGHGYLVEDWQQSPRTDAARDYEWLVLREHVKESKAHLVITAVAGLPGRSVTRFHWAAPTAAEVLAAYVADGNAAASGLITEITEKIPDRYPDAFGVGQVAAIGRRLAEDANSPETHEEVLRELSSDPGRYVREWLSAGERTDEEIQLVTALCFAASQTERVFEVMLIRLEATLGESGLLAEAESAGDKKDAEGTPAKSPQRGLRQLTTRRSIGLLEREGGRVHFLGKEARQQNLYHRYTAYELWSAYDMRFWLAIREWLAELIGDTTLRDIQVSVAVGLTVLAYTAIDEVEHSYLHLWANGERSWSGQCTVVYTLWLMSRDDELSPVALRIATDWVNSGSPACQWTAAAALSGELGGAYPAEAAARLWHLVGQWRDVPTKAVVALANLFATLTRDRDAHEAHEVLTLLRDRLNRIGDGNPDEAGNEEGQRSGPRASWREDRKNRERAMLCILQVLAAKEPLTRRPAIASFLNSRPEHLGLVAGLWAVVLRSRPCRERALTALLAAVRGFEHVSPDPEAAARSLGDALSEALPPAEHHPLSVDFTSIVARSRRPKPDAAATVQALIDAFEHLRPKERRAE